PQRPPRSTRFPYTTLFRSEKEEKKEEKKNGNGRYTRREYSYDSFSRSFELPDTVKQDGINATYHDGVLELHIPKKAEQAATAQRDRKSTRLNSSHVKISYA